MCKVLSGFLSHFRNVTKWADFFLLANDVSLLSCLNAQFFHIMYPTTYFSLCCTYRWHWIYAVCMWLLCSLAKIPCIPVIGGCIQTLCFHLRPPSRLLQRSQRRTNPLTDQTPTLTLSPSPLPLSSQPDIQRPMSSGAQLTSHSQPLKSRWCTVKLYCFVTKNLVNCWKANSQTSLAGTWKDCKNTFAISRNSVVFHMGAKPIVWMHDLPVRYATGCLWLALASRLVGGYETKHKTENITFHTAGMRLNGQCSTQKTLAVDVSPSTNHWLLKRF